MDLVSTLARPDVLTPLGCHPECVRLTDWLTVTLGEFTEVWRVECDRCGRVVAHTRPGDPRPDYVATEHRHEHIAADLTTWRESLRVMESVCLDRENREWLAAIGESVDKILSGGEK